MSGAMIETSVAVGAEEIAVTIAGSAESHQADKLSTLFGEVHDRATQMERPVVVDLRSLEFATSSCLRVFANWVIQVAEGARPYKIMFLSSGAYSWQRRSLGALAGASNGIVQIRAGA